VNSEYQEALSLSLFTNGTTNTMFGQPLAVCCCAWVQRRAASAVCSVASRASSSSLTSPAPSAHPSPLGLSPAPANTASTVVIAMAGVGERLLTPTAKHTAAVFDSASGLSATALHAVVAAAISNGDYDKSLIENVPKNYVCPIIQEIMKYSVSNSFGHSYKKAAIERWLNGHNTSPVTGEVLPNKTLTLNHTLRSMIEEWRSSHPTPTVLGNASSQANCTYPPPPVLGML
jgi:hypothetical protein